MKTVKVHIITIGDELLIGQVTDTNSVWMGEHLTAEGFIVSGRQTVGDDPDALVKALDFALAENEVVLLTGGLGPTKDDMTKKILAGYFGSNLIYNENVYANLERIILPRVGYINAFNKTQAYVPSNARIFVNSMGTAPIMWFEHEGKVVVSMPGVPYEMQNAMQSDIVPELKRHFALENLNRYKTIAVTQTTEAQLAETLESFESTLPDTIKLAYLPSLGFIKLRLSGIGVGDEYEEYLSKLKEHVKHILVSEDEILPGKIVQKKLSGSGLTIATAESCTGGAIAKMLTSVAGASEYFKGSVVAYDNHLKQTVLGVPREDLIKYGAVSEQVVLSMVKGICKLFDTDLGIATSGIAGPGGGTPDKPVGTVWIAWSIRGKCFAKKVRYPYTREVNIERTVVFSVMELIKSLR